MGVEAQKEKEEAQIRLVGSALGFCGGEDLSKVEHFPNHTISVIVTGGVQGPFLSSLFQLTNMQASTHSKYTGHVITITCMYTPPRFGGFSIF
jgi:hypothetical protein